MDHKETFINSSYYQQLRNEMLHARRFVGHALDNYGGDMENELKEAMESLQRVTDEVLKCINITGGAYNE